MEHRIGFMYNELSFARTNKNGYFEVTGVPFYLPGQHKPELMIRLENEHTSNEGRFRVTSGSRMPIEYDGEPRVNMGTVNIDSTSCLAYTAFHDAVVDYFDRVGEANRSFSINLQGYVLHGPYTIYRAVMSPKKYNWTSIVAKHELAHVLRGIYDDDEEHFDEDARKYGSDKFVVHDCNTKTSEGFAFNEGWAFFWTKVCERNNRRGAHDVAGNVAAALLNLQKQCKSSDKDMWQVLRKSPRVIHSYLEFESRHRELFKCPEAEPLQHRTAAGTVQS
ncbi:hypothetical protein BWQ96_00679 [Gracilariopsis chorda]|uniref:Uncharacterized protein n=1 Tax=Gracilariopsis chorda TaxID=448386 RepID=A0A2V3J5D9_9FLOR|nr:hypothetical protein BWQ96_00679 [Gracilariopsis chorda]|eukprot:PXF49609.1 hypothetical protein BWQ96_00679 [Gracilariopsis chorda]